MKETPWGMWEPFGVAELAGVLRPIAVPWWVAGGYALEAFAGRAWREHDDIDAGAFRPDHATIRRALLDWDVHVADPPGTLREWPPEEVLEASIHDIWVRRDAQGSWRFQFMLDERDGDEWVFGRDPRVRLPVPRLTWEAAGVRYVVPEVQLLYKSRGRREKDEIDFTVVRPLLDGRQREWLRNALTLSDPGNPWLEAL